MQSNLDSGSGGSTLGRAREIPPPGALATALAAKSGNKII